MQIQETLPQMFALNLWRTEVSLDLEVTTMIANISHPGFQARNKTCFELGHGKQDTAATRAPLEASAPQASATRCRC